MHFRNALDEVLGQRSKVILLRHLIRTEAEHTGREIARLVGLDHKTCHAALQELASEGIVHSRRIGSALAYKLNSEHAVVRRILVPAFNSEQALVEDYAEEARRGVGVPLESVILYGSVARGQESSKSDVDLLFITRDPATARAAQGRTQDVMASLTPHYGNVPQIVVVARGEFRNNVLHGHSFYRSVFETGRVIWGKSLAEVLEDVR